MKWSFSAFLVLTAILLGPHGEAQTIKRLNEQTAFGIDSEVPIQRPVKLPPAALRTLSKDERVRSCLQIENMPPEQLPANWFVASEIHLNGPNEMDLVVLPQHFCLLGANTGQIWVLRKTPRDFQLVLSAIALGVTVLSERTNGFRDIQTSAAVGGYDDTHDYRFDGRIYQVAKRSSKLIGAEAPHDLSGYETGKPLVQLRDQSSAAVMTEARAWIWKRWQARKLSYVNVRIFDGSREDTCTYYVHQSETGSWQLIMEVQRTVWEQDPATKSRRKVLEYALLVAEQVQRTEIPTDASQLPRVLSGPDGLPASMYRLQFLDYGKRIIATL